MLDKGSIFGMKDYGEFWGVSIRYHCIRISVFLAIMKVSHCPSCPSRGFPGHLLSLIQGKNSKLRSKLHSGYDANFCLKIKSP